MNKLITGQIFINDVRKGTGFLVSSNILITAKHNIISADDLIDNNLNEKEIKFVFNDTDSVLGKTSNLLNAVESNIDCVYINLYENIIEENINILVEPTNNISGFECNILGYPKICNHKINLTGKIHSFSHEEIRISINSETQLQNYEGFSGSPLIVSNNVVGVIVSQENVNTLIALPLEYIFKELNCNHFYSKKRFIPNLLNENNFSFNSISNNVKNVISMVGPRYNKKLNIKTKSYNKLITLLDKEILSNKLNSIHRNINDCINRIKFSISENNNFDFSFESKNILFDLIDNFKNDIEFFNNNNECDINQLYNNLRNYKEKIKNILSIEIERFDNVYGKNKHNNKKWIGYMASYQSCFPTANIDELKKVLFQLDSQINQIDIELFENINNQVILITGNGGSGKTHLLCDVVNNFIDKNIPAVLILGEMFNQNNNASSVIMNFYQEDKSLDEFLEWLNEYGEQTNSYIPFCIDAINEVDYSNYWNTNIPLLISKVKKYPNIKLIFSCRNIYLDEYLNENIINNILKINHNGFENIEYDALSEFCKFYCVNIDYNTINTPEFINPLFLKMLCEIAKDKDDKNIIVDDIEVLMESFFKIKNKRISSYFSDSVSIHDNILQNVLENIIDYMSSNEQYDISWLNLKKIVANTLDSFYIKEKSSKFIKLLISENILKENNSNQSVFAFAYQKFYEYIYAKRILNLDFSTILENIKNKKFNVGTLEMIQIIYFKNNKKEFINQVDNHLGKEIISSFVNGLYWRKSSEINDETITIIEHLLHSSNSNHVEIVILGLLSISTKTDFSLNAYYITKKLKCLNKYKRDYFLSFFLLGEYDNNKIIFDLCERAISLDNTNFSYKTIFLWKIILCWGTSSNYIKLRDKSSKGLTNLIKLYPMDSINLISLFSDVDDDYIHERLWQAIYSSIILLDDKNYTLSIIDYIKNNIIGNYWPQNVLLRDYLRNIFEYAYYRNWISYQNLIISRPPYKSKKHIFNKNFVQKYKGEFQDLYWNCTKSDFAIYTIPHDIQDYGLNKIDVGHMIFEDILSNGYNQIIADYDNYIDINYGSLRNRDEQVERIGKKYQKIYLYQEMGNIYDNYNYSPPIYSSIDNNIVVAPEQGIDFRNIDLTVLPKDNTFLGPSFNYPFYRYKNYEDFYWLNYDDIYNYIPNIISYFFKEKEYLILQGYISSFEKKYNSNRNIWMHIRTYFFEKNKKNVLLSWFNNKNFEGRWMPEGFGQLYECCIGEYPWSPSMINYLSQDNKSITRNDLKLPCNLICTVNDYSLEKDSQFCSFDKTSFMFPSKYLFEQMNLTWNGSFGYNNNFGKDIIINSKDNSIFIEKNFLIEFLKENELDIVWTVLGEKQKISRNTFPGRGEFSYTYNLDNSYNLICNHKKFNFLSPNKY